MVNENNNIDTSAFLISINDIRDKYFDGDSLSEDEATAMGNYDKYRLQYLNGSEDEADFDQRYFQLQVMANLHPYTDFIHFEQIPDSEA